MTLSSVVRTAWEDNILESTTIKGWTDKVYLYDVLADSQVDVALLHYETNINFLTCTTTRTSEQRLGGAVRFRFTVNCTYTIQQTDVAEESYTTLTDRLEVLDNLVRSALTGSWDSTVDYYEGPTIAEPKIVILDGKKCWQGGYRYVGIKTT